MLKRTTDQSKAKAAAAYRAARLRAQIAKALRTPKPTPTEAEVFRGMDGR